MRKKEQQLWDTFRRHGSGMWLQRIENAVGVGMPDVYVGCSGAWVELKAPTSPARPQTRWLGEEGLSPDQINWHLKAISEGRDSYILARDDLGRLALVWGQWASTINKLPWTTIEQVACATNWEDIIRELS